MKLGGKEEGFAYVRAEVEINEKYHNWKNVARDLIDIMDKLSFEEIDEDKNVNLFI